MQSGPFPGDLNRLTMIAFVYNHIDVLCLDMLTLESTDGKVRMNILEDYISWAWDVTKGKQSWQPKKSLNDDQVYLDETAPDNIVKTLLSNGDVATRLIPYKPRKLALTAPFAQSCRGWMIISTNQRDECSLGLHNCNENAQCIDTPHAFQCTCNTGYSGNGIDVMETNEELKKQIGCVPDVTTTSSTTTTTTTSTTTTSTTTTTTSTTTTTTTSTTTTTTITTTSASTTTTTTTTTSTTPEIYYEDESQWNFNDMANDFNSNFNHEEVEEEEEQEYEEHKVNETLQLDTAEESSLLSAEQVKVARVIESDDYARMKGISRICRAVECLQNLRNFVAKRDNSLLSELFDRFDEQLSLEIEGHLTRRMTKLSQL